MWLLFGSVVIGAAAVRSAGSAPPAAPAPAKAGAADVRHARVRLATGVELHLAEAGPPDGTPVLLLHGYTDSWYAWTPVLERLPAGMRAIVPTHRGHGESERPACCYRIEDFAADAVALMDVLGVERAHVIGHSMGGLIAQRIAIDYPERVDRLVIVGSAASARTEAVVAFNDVVQTLSEPIDPAFVREFQASTAAAPLPPLFLAGVVRESSKLPVRLWRDVLDGLIAPGAALDAARIRSPTLVVWGAHDALFDRASQDALVAAIADARLVVFPEAAHSPNWEYPERFVREITAFLQPAPAAAARR